MRRFLFFIFLLELLSSCSSNSIGSNDSENSKKIDTLNIEKFAYEFYLSHGDIANNSITRTEAAKEFQDKFKEEVNKCDLLKGIPMNLRTIKAQKDGKYIAHFGASGLDRDLITPFTDINFDYAIVLPRDIAIGLVEKSDYLLDVTYIGHIDEIKTFQRIVGYADWVQTESFELRPNDKRFIEETQDFDIDLGLMLVELKNSHP